MDRINISKNGIVGLCFATALLLTAAQSFGVVTNGFFDNSLSGWQSNDTGGAVWSSTSLSEDSTGSAMLQESGSLISSQLWQRFLVDDGSQTLTFTVRTPQPGSAETDYFYVGLFDDSNQSLLGDSSGFFHWNRDTAHSETSPDRQYFDWTIINNPDNGDISWLLYTFTVPVTVWNNDYVTLRFQLDNCLDAEDPVTYVLVDDVTLKGAPSNTPVVPIPGAMGLALSGLAALGVLAKKLA
jgi:hypothetical protein